MLDIAEIKKALEGSFRLAKRDVSGMAYFDQSIDGFWRSFLVVFLMAPFYFLYSLQEFQVGQEMFPNEIIETLNLTFFAIKTLLLAVDWLLFPVAMIFICRLLQLWPKYIAFIVIYNWTSLFVILVLTPIALLYISGSISAQSAASFNLLIVAPVLYYRWFIARCALQTTAATACLIVAFDLLLSLLVHGVIGKITA